jgi:hypothetical protein
MNSRQAPAGNRARSAAGAAPHAESKSANAPESAAEARRRRTAIAAFYRAQARGFAPGRELEDWLEAEREVDSLDAARHEQAATPQPAAAGANRPQSEQATPARGRAASRRARTSVRTKRGADSQARNREES